jgi:hypothetical protein
VSYRLYVELVAVTVAALMGTAAAFVYLAVFPNPIFIPQDFLAPSCITWALLAPFAVSRGVARAIMVGALSPFVGSVFVVLLHLGPAADFQLKSLSDHVRLIAFAWAVYIPLTLPITISVGIVTGVLLHAIVHHWRSPQATAR